MGNYKRFNSALMRLSFYVAALMPLFLGEMAETANADRQLQPIDMPVENEMFFAEADAESEIEGESEIESDIEADSELEARLESEINAEVDRQLKEDALAQA